MVSSKVVSRKLVPYPVFCQGKNVPFFITVKILTFWKPHHVFPAKALFHSHAGYAIRTSPNGLLPPFSGREAPLGQATSLPPAALFPRGERFSVMAKKGRGLSHVFPCAGTPSPGASAPWGGHCFPRAGGTPHGLCRCGPTHNIVPRARGTPQRAQGLGQMPSTFPRAWGRLPREDIALLRFTHSPGLGNAFWRNCWRP